MRKIISIFCLIGVASCGDNPSIKQAVRDAMLDPDSARFGDIIKYTDYDGENNACVMVNGKNTYGGYAGETAFIAYKVKSTGKWEAVQFSTSATVDCLSYIRINKFKIN